MDFLKKKVVKTRKDHQCTGCYNYKIPKGSKALNIVHVDSGDVYSSYYCDFCQETIKTIDPGEEFMAGELQEIRESEYPYEKDDLLRKKRGEL